MAYAFNEDKSKYPIEVKKVIVDNLIFRGSGSAGYDGTDLCKCLNQTSLNKINQALQEFGYPSFVTLYGYDELSYDPYEGRYITVIPELIDITDDGLGTIQFASIKFSRSISDIGGGVVERSLVLYRLNG